MAFRLSARANTDLDRILRFSLIEHGRDAASRYQLLLKTAMEELGNAPLLIGSRVVRRRSGIRAYSLSHSRLHVPPDQRVRRPVHQLVYQITDDDIEILAIIGDTYPATRVPVPRQP